MSLPSGFSGTSRGGDAAVSTWTKQVPGRTASTSIEASVRTFLSAACSSGAMCFRSANCTGNPSSCLKSTVLRRSPSEMRPWRSARSGAALSSSALPNTAPSSSHRSLSASLCASGFGYTSKALSRSVRRRIREDVRASETRAKNSRESPPASSPISPSPANVTCGGAEANAKRVRRAGRAAPPNKTPQESERARAQAVSTERSGAKGRAHVQGLQPELWRDARETQLLDRIAQERGGRPAPDDDLRGAGRFCEEMNTSILRPSLALH